MPKIDSAYPQPLCKHIALLQTSLVEMKPIAWFGLGRINGGESTLLRMLEESGFENMNSYFQYSVKYHVRKSILDPINNIVFPDLFH